MTDREKLAKLLIDSPTLDVMYGETMDEWYNAADYLISKGVTIPVRCSECKYFDIDDWDGETLYGCKFGEMEFDVNPDTYCCYGERREE